MSKLQEFIQNHRPSPIRCYTKDFERWSKEEGGTFPTIIEQGEILHIVWVADVVGSEVVYTTSLPGFKVPKRVARTEYFSLPEKVVTFPFPDITEKHMFLSEAREAFERYAYKAKKALYA